MKKYINIIKYASYEHFIERKTRITYDCLYICLHELCIYGCIRTGASDYTFIYILNLHY